MAWDTSTTRSVSFTVTVSGVVRPHESLSWGQDITSDLPDAVTAGGQVAVRTGNITWAKGSQVETQTPTPWYQGGYWIPEVGEAVTVDAHDGAGNTVRVFTGVIDTIEGDAFGNRSSKIVAEVERHNKVCRYAALTRFGSPVEAPVGNGQIRYQATTPVWVIHEIIRELGYNAVPPKPATAKLILDAPLQGSTYIYSTTSTPNARLVVSHRPGYETLAPVWSWGSDGFGVSNAVLEWVPNTGGGTGAGAVGVSILVYEGHREDALIRISHGTDADTYLRVLANKTVRVSTFVGGSTTSQTFMTPLPAGEGPHRVSAVFRAGGVDVRFGGSTYTAPMPTPAAAVTRIRLDSAIGSCVSGLQVWHPSSTTDHHAATWVPSAKIRYGTGSYSTILTPSVRDRRAREVLDDYASSLLSPIWIDGDGVLQIVTGKALHQQQPTLTVDALSQVAELSYSMAALDHRPTVEVSYDHAHHTNATSTSAKTTVWQGNAARIMPGTPEETFVEVPEDEEWIEMSDPASARQLLWPNGDYTDFLAQEGSWWGFRYANTDTTEFMSDKVTQLVETLTPWAWKVTSSTTEPDGATAATPSQYSTLPLRFRDMDLPVWRARSIVRYETRTVSVTTGSDPYRGILTHDTGKWVTTTSAATDLCQWVHEMVSTPTPVLENLVLRFDPTVDVGRKITVRARDIFGVDFEALILSADHQPYDDTTTVIARVTKVTAYAETLEAVDYAFIGQSLAEWDNARAGRTLVSVVADPHQS